jgi:hypothetical protein
MTATADGDGQIELSLGYVTRLEQLLDRVRRE